jgi:hypothetical protein
MDMLAPNVMAVTLSLKQRKGKSQNGKQARCMHDARCAMHDARCAMHDARCMMTWHTYDEAPAAQRDGVGGVAVVEFDEFEHLVGGVVVHDLVDHDRALCLRAQQSHHHTHQR